MFCIKVAVIEEEENVSDHEPGQSRVFLGLALMLIHVSTGGRAESRK